jgi:hypothetical protein
MTRREHPLSPYILRSLNAVMTTMGRWTPFQLSGGDRNEPQLWMSRLSTPVESRMPVYQGKATIRTGDLAIGLPAICHFSLSSFLAKLSSIPRLQRYVLLSPQHSQQKGTAAFCPAFRARELNRAHLQGLNLASADALTMGLRATMRGLVRVHLLRRLHSS